MSRIAIVLGLITIMLTQGFSQAETNHQKEKKILDELLANYDKDLRPNGANETGGPVKVNVNMFVRSLSKIDDVKMEYQIQITFRQQWLDDRLNFESQNFGKNFRFLTIPQTHQVWKPDIFFSNEVESNFHNMMKPNQYLRVSPNGEVLYSTRISITFSCPMILKLFPFDKQTCSMRLASYGSTTESIVLNWKEADPVMVTSDLHLPRHSLMKFTTDHCDSQTNTGTYSCLRVDFLFKREFSYYLVQIYIPCCMLVILSWVSFWLDRNAVTARIFLGVSTLLTMAVQVANFNQTVPLVSYTKALDVWTGVCLTFLFFAILEFATANFFFRFEESQKLSKRETGQEIWDPDSSFICFSKSWFSQCPLSHKVDVFARFIFPILFIIFNLTYWGCYLERNDDYDME